MLEYDHFNWYQVVVNAPHSEEMLGMSAPFVDPQPGGGPAFGGWADNLPFYYDEQGETGTGYYLSDHTTITTLDFGDRPANSRLETGEQLEFLTSLAGIRADGTWDVLYSFSWASDYNGTAGGVDVFRSLTLPTGGTGGVFDVSLDLQPWDLPVEVLQLMAGDGAQNVPEPATMLMLGTGLVFGIGLLNRRRMK